MNVVFQGVTRPSFMHAVRWLTLLVSVIILMTTLTVDASSPSESSRLAECRNLGSLPYSLEYPEKPTISFHADAGSPTYNMIASSIFNKRGFKVHGIKAAITTDSLCLDVNLYPEDAFGNCRYIITISEVPTTRTYKQLEVEIDPMSQKAYVRGKAISTAGFSPEERDTSILFADSVPWSVNIVDDARLHVAIPLSSLSDFVNMTELLNWRTGFSILYSMGDQDDRYYFTGDSVGRIWTSERQGAFATWYSSGTVDIYAPIVSDTATIVTYNTLFAGAPVYMEGSAEFTWYDKGDRIPKFEKVLKGVAADIIGFQECVGWQPGGMFEYVPAELSSRLKMNYVVGDAFNGWSVALFSKFKILNTETYTGNSTFRNAALRAEIEIAPGTVLTVFVVHVDSRQARSNGGRLANIVKPFVSSYAVVMGDFNLRYALSNWGRGTPSALLAMDHQGWIREASIVDNLGRTTTMPDYIFFSPSLAVCATPTLEMNRFSHPLGFNPNFLWEISDHLPVIAKFSIRK